MEVITLVCVYKCMIMQLVVCMQENFESLFHHYDVSAQFQYLKSFRRARIIFQSLASAAAAHQQLYNHEYHGQQIKCYYAQVVCLFVCLSVCACSYIDAVLCSG